MSTINKNTQPNYQHLNFMLGALIDCINQLPDIEKVFIKNILNQKIRCVDDEHKIILKTLIGTLE